MNREAVMSGLLASVAPKTGYSVERVLSRLVLRASNGREVGFVLFGSSTDALRCVVWHGDDLAAECHFSWEVGWKVFPITGGKRSSFSLSVDPLRFLIEEDSTQVLRAAAVS